MMKRGDMVKHVTDGRRSRGLVVEIHPEGGVMVQWQNGELIRYWGENAGDIVALGWNLYVK